MKSFFASLRIHWVRTLIVLAVFIGIGIYLYSRSGSNSSTPTYQTASVEKGTLISSVTGSGTVSTANSVQLTTQSSGVIKKIYVKNGDTVKVGQKIADIEFDQTGQQRYSSALSSYQSALNAVAAAKSGLYSAQSKMFAANQKFINDAAERDLATSDPTYIQQNADWKASEADYLRQQSVITQSQNALSAAWISYQQSSPAIYAPLTGTLTGFSLQEGSVITAQTTTTGSTSSQKIASVTTNAIPTIAVNLTQIDVPKVKVGQKATITLDAYAEKTFTGKIVSIDTVGSVSSSVTSYPTVIALDEKNADILPNMSAQATIILDSKTDVLMVPASAITRTDGVSTARILKNNTPEVVPVTTGLTSDSHIEIVSGLQEGDTVITAVVTSSSTSGTSTSPFSSFGGARGGSGATRIQAR